MSALVNARFLVAVFRVLPLSRFRPIGPAPLGPRPRRSGHRPRQSVSAGTLGRPADVPPAG